ncbi:MAG: energy-coupling factor ABC transporter permease [candidate division Zixibacteria bacterium]|nr:energy-coupling factor ABC transporter permease [candidate division Zixibacteria bacterium]
MHIPDGFLDTKTWVALDALAVGATALAVGRTRRVMGEKQIPLLGVLAAFIFAAQMVNFPVAGGTSGHFMGAALAAILLGPWSAVLVMTIVLIIQCLMFQDGGLTALGANMVNMGVIGAMLAYGLYRGGQRILGGGMRPRPVAVFGAAWMSIVLAASACAMELAVSGTVPIGAALPAMAGVHALIGIGEGIITVLVVGFIAQVRPDLLELQKE